MMEMKKRNLAVIIIVAALTGSMATALALNFLPDNGVRISREDYSTYKGFMNKYGKVEALYQTLEMYYYEELDPKKLVEGMCYGLFEGTGDPYTNYMSKEEYDNLMIKTTGKLDGIGVTVGANTEGYIVVVSTIKGSPAEKGGMQSGDLIIAVDGVSYKGSELDQAVANMRGQAGTKVDITYLRDGKQQAVTLSRASLNIQSVYGEMLEGSIGYIYVSNFETNTAEDFSTELKKLESQGAKGLVIDLRNNGGGVVESGVKLADQLLDQGTLAYMEGRVQKREYMKTTDGKTELPYVVLINGGTASTSEIVAAGIKDNGGGKLIGSQSFGKGVIQSMAPLKGGDAVKVTIAQYFSPKGNIIQGIGIEPDYVVELPEDATVDTQLEKAIEVLKENPVFK